MGELFSAPPWPSPSFVLDLDAMSPQVGMDDLLALERRSAPVVGVVRGRCEGPALAAAVSVQLLVASPVAMFQATGETSDLVVRRAAGLVGRRVATYLAVASVGAADALLWGLVNRVAQHPEQVAQEWCEQLRQRSAVAGAVIMEQLGRDAPRDHALSRVTSRSLAASLAAARPERPGPSN